MGCGNIGFSPDGQVIFAAQCLWPQGSLEWARDYQGKRVGDKTTTLEFMGMLLPFLLVPETLINQHVVVKVDNVGCYYGWLNRQVAGDAMACLFIRALHLISAFLGCQVHVAHLPRCQTWEARVVDQLSREDTTVGPVRALLQSFQLRPYPRCLVQWMENPRQDWDLPMQLLRFVEDVCNK